MDNSDYDKKVDELKKKIKSFPDFPRKGILFWDILSAISDGPTCVLLQNILVHSIKRHYPDVQAVAGLEARGFLFSFSLAAELGVGCICLRKKGKIPGDTKMYTYDLEYGTDTLEIQQSSVSPGLRCVVIDDLLATGGTMAAATHLLTACQAEVLGGLVIMELTNLKGRQNVPVKVHSIIQY